MGKKTVASQSTPNTFPSYPNQKPEVPCSPFKGVPVAQTVFFAARAWVGEELLEVPAPAQQPPVAAERLQHLGVRGSSFVLDGCEIQFALRKFD